MKSDKAHGRYWMLSKNNSQWIENLINAKAKKFGVEIKEFVNMGNHIHFQIRINSRKSFQDFLRSITNLIARHVTGAKKGKPFGRFWQGLAFTRIVSTFKEELKLQGYLIGNRVERKHGYNARQVYLQALNKWMKKLKQESVPLCSVRIS